MNAKKFASYLDLASHSADTTEKKVQAICADVLHYGFNSAFVNPYYIPFARTIMKKEGKVGTVASFPLGQETHTTKLLSIKEMVLLGADEIDVSLNVALIKEAKWQQSFDEMASIVDIVRTTKATTIVKFIPETGYLTPLEIQKTAESMAKSGADFFKTCSGMGPRGAIVEDVQLVRKAIGQALRIKVAGGIRTYAQAQAFIDAGADRIGTSSAVKILEEYQRSNK